MLATELKTGTIYKEDGFPLKVEKYSHSKVARAGATVKVRARNLITGSVVDRSYTGSAKLEQADTLRKNAQYLYKDTSYVFMDPDTYNQFSISEELLGDAKFFLSEGEMAQVLYFENDPVSVELPNTMIYEVTYTEPGHKGNTVSQVYKDATLSNGFVAKVPTFIKIGDKVKIDTRTGEYASKA